MMEFLLEQSSGLFFLLSFDIFLLLCLFFCRFLWASEIFFRTDEGVFGRFLRDRDIDIDVTTVSRLHFFSGE
jgi:hypothetical protein